MPQLIVDPFLLIRSPAYSYENFNEHSLRKSLRTDFFRAGIFFASQTLYLELRKKDFDYDQVSSQVRVTLWKYFNRMCFRSLPYGFFSTYAAGKWSETGKMYLTEEELIIYPDFKLLTTYINSLDAENFESIRYDVNNSLYPSSRELRFLSQVDKDKYTIVQLKVVPGLKKLLDFIRKGKTRGEIISYLKNEYEDDDMVADYFQSLVSGQVIFSEFKPNITGTPYYQRMLSLLRTTQGVDLNQLKSFRQHLDHQSQPLPQLIDYIDGIIASQSENAAYSLYHRTITGGVRDSLKTKLLTLIKNLDKLTAGQSIDIMSKFRADFTKKYEQQEVPLLSALDPGSGIGYDNLASAFTPENENFIDDLHHQDEGKNSTQWGDTEKMIFKKWSSLSSSGQRKIMITAEDLAKLPASKHRLPPGLFVLFKNMDDQLWIDGVGGVSGIELSARFGEHGSVIEENLRRICQLEATVNNDFIFAEISFSPNDRTSNINQRGHLYEYEIPVLTFTTLEEAKVIRLSDLMISIRDGQILLRSARLNKYIIPRLSSAYNYKISTIPVFRFLCDLQFQNIKANLSFSLADLFPGLDYYPRFEVEQAVLSPETWILNEEQLKKIAETDGPLDPEMNLPNYFSLHEGDNYLVFNQSNPTDLSVFRKCIRNKKTAKLTEYCYPKTSDLKNASGEAFNSQMIACITNQSKSYLVPRYQVASHSKNYRKVKRSFLPFDEWVYLKVYAHYSITDEILSTIVWPLIRKYKKLYPDLKWFFIRYEEHGHHLRIRFLTEGKSAYALLSELVQKLQPLSEQGKIGDVMLDCYQRELEKYSFELINEIESFFYRDSEYILSLLNHEGINTSYKLSFAVISSLQLIQKFIPDQKQCTAYLSEVMENVSAEFRRDKEVVHKLDVKYRNFQKELISSQAYFVSRNVRSKTYNEYLKMQHQLVGAIAGWEKADQYNLLINLVHMHINRIFERTPRAYEYLVYHFMKKHQAYLNHTSRQAW